MLVIRKERLSKMYNFSAYFIARILVDSIILIINPTLTWTIIYLMSGLSISWYFAFSLITNYLLTYVAQVLFKLNKAIALFFSSFGLSYIETTGIMSIFFLFTILLGGFSNSNLPSTIKWARYISPVFYCFSIQIWIQLMANGGLPCTSNGKNYSMNMYSENLCQPNAKSVPMDIVLKMYSINLFPGYMYIIASLTLIVLHGISYFVLRKTIKKFRR